MPGGEKRAGLEPAGHNHVLADELKIMKYLGDTVTSVVNPIYNNINTRGM
jgi:hypothetical protein